MFLSGSRRFMRPTYVLTGFIIAATLLGAGVNTSAVQAAPVTNGIRFNVSARIISLEDGKAGSLPPQILNARVWLQGTKARVETEARDRLVVFLFQQPYLTKLLPDAKAGVRWKVGKARPSALPNATRFTVQNFFGSPANIRTALVKSGAKRTGSAKLNGVVTDIYTASDLGGHKQKVTAWIRRSDALPLRMQTISPTLSTTLSWSSYKRSNLPSSLFNVPNDYAMRDSSGQPYL